MSDGYKPVSSLSEIEVLEGTISTIKGATRRRRFYKDLLSENSKVKQIWRAAKGGSWRTTVTVGAILTSLVLVANIIVLIWTCFTLETIDGVALAFRGSCAKSERMTVWAHFGINVLSTLLLSASNNCAQLLSSPAREDINRTHALGNWMDVGHAPSWRNIKFLPKHRTALILVLITSSIPLHLLYNSVVFNTVSANAYRTVIVTEDFVSGPAPNRSGLVSAYDPTTALQILNLYNDSSDLTKLGAYECIEAYRPSFISEWGDVLLVTKWNWNGSWPEEIGNTTQYIPGELGWD